MKKLPLLLAFCCWQYYATAQITFTCSYTGTTEVISGHAFEPADLDEEEQIMDTQIKAIVKSILSEFYLPEDQITVQSSLQVNNANATMKEGKAYILYSKYFIESVKNKTNGDWRLKGILAHEIAHHILFHTAQSNSSRRDLELQADKWAGAVLYKLGATITQATVCVSETNTNGSSTHPPRYERLASVKLGWLEAKRKNNNQPPKPEPDRTSDPFADQMIYVQNGSFQMGSNDGDSDEKPAHTVSVCSFYMSKYEVTQKQWRDIMGTNPSYFKNCDNCPVKQVSWNDIQDFIKKLNAKTGKNYRLPTEAEWEYAARGGQSYKYAGSDNIDNVAWYTSNSGSKTHPVGQKSANGYGLYDMSGNVWEWCQDTWHENYNNAPTNGTAWLTGGDNSRRVLRGGSWNSDDSDCRVASRYRVYPTSRNNSISFRLARGI
jgi:formylglycine-generating enzyme required for sulfatase activity